MNTSHFTAISAMNAFQRDLDVAINDTANISTSGYKPMRSSSDNLLYVQMDMRPQVQVGREVKNDGPGTILRQGIFHKTDRKLDFAMPGNAFPTTRTSEDEERPTYTRDGVFQVSSMKGGNYLTTSDGSYVLGQDGDPIELEYKQSGDGGDGAPGELDLDHLTEQIGLFACEGPEGLTHADVNLFHTGETSGEWVSIEDLDDEEKKNKILTMTPRLSNSNISTEMVSLVQT